MIGRTPTMTPWRAARYLLPFASIVAAALIMPLPLSIKLGGYWLMPSLPILGVFFWAVFRPDLLPSFAVVFAGLLMDFLVHAPIGCSSLAFLTVYLIVISQRLYWMSLPGPALLVGFVIVAAAGETVFWLATSFAYGRLISPVPALFEAIMSVLAFPLVSRAFAPLQRLAGPPV